MTRKCSPPFPVAKWISLILCTLLSCCTSTIPPGGMPEIETMVSTFAENGTVFVRDFYRAWLAYWPPQFGPISYILDDSEAIEAVNRCIGQACGAPALKYFSYKSFGGVHGKNSLKFVADLTSSAEVIAFFDDDACLLDHVIPSDLITDDRRLIARGVNKGVNQWIYGRHALAIKLQSTASYMIEFPVMVWRDMLPDFRAHVVHAAFGVNESSPKLFFEAFHKLWDYQKRGIACEFCLILNFAHDSPKWRHRYRFDLYPEKSPMLVLSRHHFLTCPRPPVFGQRDEVAFLESRLNHSVFPWDSNAWPGAQLRIAQQKGPEVMRGVRRLLEERLGELRAFMAATPPSEASWSQRCGAQVDEVWAACLRSNKAGTMKRKQDRMKRWWDLNQRGLALKPGNNGRAGHGWRGGKRQRSMRKGRAAREGEEQAAG